MTRPIPRGFKPEGRTYVVRCYDYGEFRVEAKSPSGAKYKVFLQGRDAGYFGGRDGFRRFLDRNWTASEVRR